MKLKFTSTCLVDVFNFFVFFPRGCQDGQLRQMSDSVQPPVCNVCSSLHKLQTGGLPCLVSVTHLLYLLFTIVSILLMAGFNEALLTCHLHTQVVSDLKFLQTIPDKAWQSHASLTTLSTAVWSSDKSL